MRPCPGQAVRHGQRRRQSGHSGVCRSPHGQRADRGVFITTSRFSAAVGVYVQNIPNRIVLIDGQWLAELMVLHNVGVQDESTFVFKRLDEDSSSHDR
ncbi:MAG: restriction endonuclease [Pseudonocardia sp.]|nr:restriction endonuclease [Pseudonocardia sp.]